MKHIDHSEPERGGSRRLFGLLRVQVIPKRRQGEDIPLPLERGQKRDPRLGRPGPMEQLGKAAEGLKQLRERGLFKKK